MQRLLPALALLLGLGASALAATAEAPKPAAAPPPPAVSADTLSQTDAGAALIRAVLSGKPEAVTPYLIDSLRAEVTPEVLESLRSQYAWLYDLLRGDFVESMRGPRVFEDGTRTYYREYQLGHAGDRAPLLVIQVLFPDSVRPQAIGMQVKSFLGNEKMISGEKTWKVEGRTVDLQSMVLAEGAEGKFLALFVHDPDTAALERGRIARIGPPVIREAIARGYLDTAKAANGGVDVQKTVGLVFMRRDPNLGFVHVRVAFRPEEYAVGGAERLLAAQADSAAASKAKPKPAPKKSKKK